jgi:hypothetical protein
MVPDRAKSARLKHVRSENGARIIWNTPCSVSDHSAQTPRTPLLASPLLLDRTQRFSANHKVSGPACVDRSNRRSARAWHFPKSHSTCVLFADVPLHRAAGMSRPALRRTTSSAGPGPTRGGAAGECRYAGATAKTSSISQSRQRGDAVVARAARRVSRTGRRL